MSGIPPDSDSGREEGDRTTGPPPNFEFLDYGADAPARSTEESNDSTDSAHRQQPRFAHFMFSFRSRLPHSQEKATAAALSALKRIPVAQLGDHDSNCVICYEPLEDPSEEQLEEQLEEERRANRKVEADQAQAGQTAEQAAEQNSAAPADTPGQPSTPHPCPNDHSPTQMPCNHLFGRSCLYSWLKGNTTCPICRQAVEGEDESEGEQHHYQVLNLNLDVFLPEENGNVIQDMLRDGTINMPLVRLFSPEAAAAAAASGGTGEGEQTEIPAEGSTGEQSARRSRPAVNRLHIHHLRHPGGFQRFGHGHTHRRRRPDESENEDQDRVLPEMGRNHHAAHHAAHEAAHQAINAALERIMRPNASSREQTDQPQYGSPEVSSPASSDLSSLITSEAITQALARAQSATQTQDTNSDLAYMYFERPGRDQARQASERAISEQSAFLSLMQRMMRRGEEQRQERQTGENSQEPQEAQSHSQPADHSGSQPDESMEPDSQLPRQGPVRRRREQNGPYTRNRRNS